MANIKKDCGCGQIPQIDLTRPNLVYNHNLCSDITVDLLMQYQRPIQCYITNNLGSQTGISDMELQNANTVLSNYIIAKAADPNTCEFKEQLPIIQALVTKIIIKGMCL